MAGWPPVRPAAGDVLAARKAVRLFSPAGRRLPGRWQAWANASLVPTVRGPVTLKLSGCPKLPKVAGCVYTARPRVVYLKRGLRNPRGVLLHELGHVYDLAVMSDADRERFRKIMGQPVSRKWWTGATPLAEWFAEGYSWCARYSHIVSIERYAIYHYRPSGFQHRRVCALITAAARDRTPPAPPNAPPVVSGDPAPPPPPSMSPGTVPGDPAGPPNGAAGGGGRPAPAAPAVDVARHRARGPAARSGPGPARAPERHADSHPDCLAARASRADRRTSHADAHRRHRERRH